MNILDLIFPKSCLECGKGNKYICSDCIKKVRRLGEFPGERISVFKYEGVIRKAIISLKYKFSSDISEEIAELISKELKKMNLNLKEVVLVPIPLHPKRQKMRGFNQSEVVGEYLANKMRWELNKDILVKNTNTKPQVGLKGRERHLNLKNTFSLNKKQNLKGKTIIIFDDVYTTGSTIKEAIKVLKKTRPKKLMSLTIAG